MTVIPQMDARIERGNLFLYLFYTEIKDIMKKNGGW